MSTDLFAFIEFEKVAVFTLPKDAWLDFSFYFNERLFLFEIKIKANDTETAFELSAGYNFLDSFLEAATDLLPHYDNYDKYTGRLRTYTYCSLDDGDGGPGYYMNFKNVHSSVQVLVRKDITSEQMDDGLHYGVDIPEELQGEKTIEEVKDTIMISFQLPNNHFAYKLKEACDNLLLQLPLNKYQEILGYPFSEKYYHRLAEYCNQKPYGFP